MKKIPSILIIAAFLFAACDPGYSFDFAINNQSQHAVTIQSLDTTHHYKTLYAPAQTDTTVYSNGGIGYAEIPHITEDIHWDIYGDSVQVLFDDGRTLKYNIFSDTNGGLYCFKDTNRYVYRPRMKRPAFNHHPGYCQYILVITDNDYNMSE